MTERSCLRLSQDGRCNACGGAPLLIEVVRDGHAMTESTCPSCNAYRIDPAAPIHQQSADEQFMQTLTQ